VIVGSNAVVSDHVVTQLYANAPPGVQMQRLGGFDRYGTAALVSQHSHPGTAPVVYITVGTNFPDALAGGPAAARQGAPMLLVRGNLVPPDTASELRRLDPGTIVILGSAGIIPETIREEIQRLARQ
jgi:putative cell wall-binding protein